MSAEEAKILTIARERVREVGWRNYRRKRNASNAVCVLEAIEYAASGDLAAYFNISSLFKEANQISTGLIKWNDDPTFKRNKREVIRAFNVAIDYAKR